MIIKVPHDEYLTTLWQLGLEDNEKGHRDFVAMLMHDTEDYMVDQIELNRDIFEASEDEIRTMNIMQVQDASPTARCEEPEDFIEWVSQETVDGIVLITCLVKEYY